MKVLDLFSGLGGFSQAFIDRGHDVITYELNPKFKPDVCVDIMELDELPKCDVILASPPCEKFSVAAIGRYWRGCEISVEAKEALRLVEHTLSLIYWTRPKYWFLENPTGMLRTIIGNPPVEIYFAQYGEKS